MSAVSADRRSVAILERLVAAGADPRAVSAHGYNAFHAAVGTSREHDGDEETVFAILRYLKKLGVEINLRNARGHTALARAVIAGDEIETRRSASWAPIPTRPRPRWPWKGQTRR